MSELREKLSVLLNQHCRENCSNTPDFILAQYMLDTMDACDKAIKLRDQWYGIEAGPGGVGVSGGGT